MATDPLSSHIEEMRAAGVVVQDLAAVLSGLRPMCRLGLGKDAGQVRQLLERSARAGALAVHAYRSDYEGVGLEILLLGKDPRRLAAFAEAAFAKSRAKTAAQSRLCTRAMGALLGYPDCCVGAFARAETGKGSGLLGLAAVERSAKRPHPFQANFLYNFHSRTGEPLRRMIDGGYRGMDLYLVPWVPCSLGCAATRRYGKRLFDLLEGMSPEFAERLGETLVAPIVFFDDWRFAPLLGARRRGRRLSYEGVADMKTLLSREQLRLLVSGDALLMPARGPIKVMKGVEALGELEGARVVEFK